MNLADPVVALRWTVAIAALASLVAAMELIAVAMWHRNGVFWRCCQAVMTEREGTGPLAKRMNAYREPATRIVLVVYAVAAGATLLLVFSGARYQEALLVLTAVSLAVSYWRVVGGDGATQMTLIVLTACSLGALLGGGETGGARSVLWFVGLQGILAYFVSGVAKLVSSEWRNEDVVSKIASTVCYGHDAAARVLESVPGLGRIMTLSVIGFEIAMPFALVFPVQVTVAFLAVALFFHIGCAFVMGLNDFVWAFAATFPGILFLSNTINTSLW